MSGWIESKESLMTTDNVEITKRGIISTASDHSSVELSNGAVIFRDSSGNVIKALTAETIKNL